MSRLTDRSYLLGEQYRDASNLNARIHLHERFSTNARGWMPWLLDQLALPATCRILELGTGPGDLWRKNAGRTPPGWDVTLSDLSPGMVEAARGALAGVPHPFAFAVADAQAIPFPNATFDAVIASSMLYHVPDRPRALAEIRRVLAPGGRLYAATVGEAHLRELDDLLRRFDPAPETYGASAASPFTLENAPAQLAPYFPQIELRPYEDALVITEAAPLVAYLLSMARTDSLSAERTAELAAFVERELVAHGGALRITKDSGVFICERGDAA